jgi:hypothetical protein
MYSPSTTFQIGLERWVEVKILLFELDPDQSPTLK